VIYKISYVVVGSEHAGAIANAEEAPQVGDRVRLGKHEFEVVEVLELMPPSDNFAYLHATCRLVSEE
jgi:hypothetical protein